LSRRDKALELVLSGAADAAFPFHGLCAVLRNLGFVERVKGSHHIFARDDIAEIINIQPRGAEAKPYQVKQVRGIILKYRLGGRA
jgi:predicted RNA binding protein YcfA (HicA-like mRNA interferase family)